jgi:hypothetical protein
MWQHSHMPKNSLQIAPQSLKSYTTLRNAVTFSLLEGQKELEALKVEIYWRTGRLIDAYLKEHPESENQKQGVVERLSADLKMERSLFYRILQFARQFPDVATWRHLTWSHYRALLGVRDDEQRLAIAERAEEQKWPARRLDEEIRNHSKKNDPSPNGYQLPRLKEPKKGIPGTYRIGWLEPLGEAPRKVMDFGFEIYEEWPFKINAVKDGEIFFRYSNEAKRWISGGASENLYSYEAHVEDVTDGDTLRVQIRLPNATVKRQYLRLRGINAEPLETPKGKKARDFLARIFKKQPSIILKSRFRDAYGRYVADVWADGVYINQLLLDKFLALKV